MKRNDVQELFYKIRGILVWFDMEDHARQVLRGILNDLDTYLDSTESVGPDVENN